MAGNRLQVPKSMALRATFIDRDGTINIDKGHVFRAKDFEYIPGALTALKLLTDREVKIYIVTNQAGIAKGLYTEMDFADLTRTMLGQMAEYGIVIADVLYCPHHPDALDFAYRQTCTCRKPEPGLLRQVMDKQGFMPGNLAMIGDKNSDVEAGRAVGVTTYLVETGYGTREKEVTRADHVVSDLQAAVTHLLKEDG
jgi:D-glycero-D-manno-heptose 1,7-bisphosphate phosphatase